MKIGRAIRYIRDAHKMSVGDLAARSKISAPLVSLIENGKREPTIDVLNKVAQALNTPVETFLLLSRPDGTLTTSDEKIRGVTDAISALYDAERLLMERLRECANE